MEKTVVLFVHGFMGSKKQFSELTEKLIDCEADIRLHVLPGHDSTLWDFRTTNAHSWQGSVDNAVEQLSKEYERVILVGHSMGGLLSVCSAAKNPKRIAGVVAIGFPIKISLKRQWIDLNLKASHPQMEGEDPRVTAARSMAGVTIKSAGQYFSTMPQSIQFLKTTRKARSELHLVKAPLTVINFENDEIVAASTAKFVREQLPSAKVVMLKDSYHFLFTGDDLNVMVEEIKAVVNGAEARV